MVAAKTVRFAVVGCGAIADAHVGAITAFDGTELVAGVDTDPIARQRCEREWKRPSFSSVEDMLAEHSPDAACVCTPPASHPAVTSQLLESGLHVLCEKPLAIGVTEAEGMVRDSRKSGRHLRVSQKFRFADDLLLAADMVRAGAIGRPTSYQVTFCAPVDVRGRWPSEPVISGGGVVMDNAPHALDVLAHVTASPLRTVTAAFAEQHTSPRVEHTAEILFDTIEGQTGRISLSWSHFSRDLDYLSVVGSEGTVCVSWTGLRTRRHGEREWTHAGSGYDKKQVFSSQLEAFVAGLASSEPGISVDDGLAAVRFVEAVYEAQRNKTWVELGRKVRRGAVGA